MFSGRGRRGQSGALPRRASYLAERLAPPDKRARFAKPLASDRDAFVHAMYADAFKSPAKNVSIFFADLFGMSEVYNRPGAIDLANWTLRIPPGAVAKLDLGRAAKMALSELADE